MSLIKIPLSENFGKTLCRKREFISKSRILICVHKNLSLVLEKIWAFFHVQESHSCHLFILEYFDQKVKKTCLYLWAPSWWVSWLETICWAVRTSPFLSEGHKLCQLHVLSMGCFFCGVTTTVPSIAYTLPQGNLVTCVSRSHPGPLWLQTKYPLPFNSTVRIHPNLLITYLDLHLQPVLTSAVSPLPRVLAFARPIPLSPSSFFLCICANPVQPFSPSPSPHQIPHLPWPPQQTVISLCPKFLQGLYCLSMSHTQLFVGFFIWLTIFAPSKLSSRFLKYFISCLLSLVTQHMVSTQ